MILKVSTSRGIGQTLPGHVNVEFFERMSKSWIRMSGYGQPINAGNLINSRLDFPIQLTIAQPFERRLYEDLFSTTLHNSFGYNWVSNIKKFDFNNTRVIVFGIWGTAIVNSWCNWYSFHSWSDVYTWNATAWLVTNQVFEITVMNYKRCNMRFPDVRLVFHGCWLIGMIAKCIGHTGHCRRAWGWVHVLKLTVPCMDVHMLEQLEDWPIERFRSGTSAYVNRSISSTHVHWILQYDIVDTKMARPAFVFIGSRRFNFECTLNWMWLSSCHAPSSLFIFFVQQSVVEIRFCCSYYRGKKERSSLEWITSTAVCIILGRTAIFEVRSGCHHA